MKKYDDVFGSYWKVDPSTMRSNKRHALDNAIDGGDMQKQIFEILELSHMKNTE